MAKSACPASTGPYAYEWSNMSNHLLLGIGGIALALSVAAASSIRADQGPAVTAHENGAYNLATCEFQAVPHCDDAAAQYYLGLLFKDGLGVPSDPVAALGWFLCAARSDGQIGRDAAKWVEQLSSSLGGPSVLVAQKKVLGCLTLAEIAPRLDTSEASERPDSGKRSFWKNLQIKLNQYIGVLSRTDISGPDGVAAAGRTVAHEPPKFRARKTVVVPDRRTAWSRLFFLPADGTVVGTQHIARKLGADELFLDMREKAQDGDNFPLGLFAVFWWVLICKSLLSVGRAILGPSRRPGTRQLGQSGGSAPWR